jgi:hypothetical protein
VVDEPREHRQLARLDGVLEHRRRQPVDDDEDDRLGAR